MKSNFLLTFLILLNTSLFAQFTAGMEIKSGYSSFHMQELSRVLHSFKTNSEYPVEIINDYPAFLTYGINTFLKFDFIEVGLDYNYFSTGGRVQYRDYSGGLGIDQLATAHVLGIFAKTPLYVKDKFEVKGSLMLSQYFSKVNNKFYTVAGDVSDEIVIEVVSKSPAITPSVETVFILSKRLYTGIRLGYCLNIPGALHLRGNKALKLMDLTSNTTIRTQWSGFRSDLFLGFNLK